MSTDSICYVCQQNVSPCEMNWASSYSSALCTIQGKNAIKLTCGHIFHEKCFDKHSS